MTSPDGMGENIRLIRQLSNELAAYLSTLPEDVWRTADTYASGCDQWKIADVVTHLITEAMAASICIERALKGDTSPPLGYSPLDKRETVDRVVSMRVTLDEDLFPEFNTSCRHLNTLLASLVPAEHSVPAWHSLGVVPISRLVEHRVVELAVHGWDIRYGLDRSAGLSPAALPFLTHYMGRWLCQAFQPGESLESPITYRFRLNDPATESYDVVVSGNGFCLGPSGDADADVTFQCETGAYILFATGRLPFARSVRRGQLSFEGDEALASRFTEWFGPV